MHNGVKAILKLHMNYQRFDEIFSKLLILIIKIVTWNSGRIKKQYATSFPDLKFKPRTSKKKNASVKFY